MVMIPYSSDQIPAELGSAAVAVYFDNLREQVLYSHISDERKTDLWEEIATIEEEFYAQYSPPTQVIVPRILQELYVCTDDPEILKEQLEAVKSGQIEGAEAQIIVAEASAAKAFIQSDESLDTLLEEVRLQIAAMTVFPEETVAISSPDRPVLTVASTLHSEISDAAPTFNLPGTVVPLDSGENGSIQFQWSVMDRTNFDQAPSLEGDTVFSGLTISSEELQELQKAGFPIQLLTASASGAILPKDSTIPSSADQVTQVYDQAFAGVAEQLAAIAKDLGPESSGAATIAVMQKLVSDKIAQRAQEQKDRERAQEIVKGLLEESRKEESRQQSLVRTGNFKRGQ
ncbi:MAG: hypothetical protein Q7S00_07965, partial [bacterium]|nr:hypothetical protein [bacterium]